MKLNTLILFSALMMSCVSCQSLKRIGANKHSYRNEKEDVTLSIVRKPGFLSNKETKEMPKALETAAVIDQAVKLLVKGASHVMKKEGERYTASYTASASQESLADFGGFTITRTAAKAGQPAMSATFLTETSKFKSAFKLELDKVVLNDAKAKVPFQDDDVDISVKVVIEYITDERETGTIEETFTLKGLKIRGEPYSKPVKSGWIPVPKAVVNTPYDIHVSITETNDFGKWFSKISSEIDSNEDSLIKAIKGS
jgi:hypothetical protein